MLNTKKLFTKILDAIKADYVVERGASGTFHYRKWKSGEAEFWGYVQGNVPNGWSSTGVEITYPFELNALSWSVVQSAYQIDICYLSGGSNTKAYVQTHSSAALTNTAFRVSFRGTLV